MPLPELKQYRVAEANAREYRKRVLLGDAPEQAAHAVGATVEKLEREPRAQEYAAGLARAIEPAELELLRETPRDRARPALESREGRIKWLEGVIHGDIKVEGAFGTMKQFPPSVIVSAFKLLQDAYGDRTINHQVTTTEQRVFVFKIPDNGRVPEQIVDAPQE